MNLAGFDMVNSFGFLFLSIPLKELNHFLWKSHFSLKKYGERIFFLLNQAIGSSIFRLLFPLFELLIFALKKM